MTNGPTPTKSQGQLCTRYREWGKVGGPALPFNVHRICMNLQ